MNLVKMLAFALACLAATGAQAAEPSVLTYARSASFESMDPPRAADETSSEVILQVYSTLLSYAYLERPYKLTPDLLESMPTLSADKLTYTFHLRKGVHFHDNACFPGGKGREVTADDALYSLKRYADARINSKSWFAMEGAVVGLDAWRAATAKAPADADLTKADIAGLRRIDASTFSITLTRPNGLFLFALTLGSTAIVPVEAVQMYKDRFAVNPVGTGPFTLKGPVDRKSTLHFLRNPDYYGRYPSVGAPGDAEKGLLKDAGKRLPIADAIDMPLIEESQPAALKFLRGEIDWRGLDRSNFTKMVVRAPDGQFRLGDEYASKFNIYWTIGNDDWFIMLNMKDPVLGRNKLLRQAMAATFDPKAVIDVLYNGRQRALESIVPYELPGNERESGAVTNHHDLARAKKLLADAGFPGGNGLPAFTMVFSSGNAEYHNLFDLLRAQFATAGIQLKADFMDVPTFSKATSGGNFQLAWTGWVADYPDPENFYQLMYSKNAAPGPNSGSYADPAYDKAYEAMRLMPNGPQRLEYIRTMNARLKDDVPVMFAYDTLRFGVLQKWVGNFKRNLLQPEFMFLSVDMAAKKKGL
ncbi:MAG: ABC transporter substrate-binding protein [Caulobacter sp.]|nr:ABC transporter substrate-binding protein [Vitreoscilla sp.]